MTLADDLRPHTDAILAAAQAADTTIAGLRTEVAAQTARATALAAQVAVLTAPKFVVGTTEPTWATVGCQVPVANLTRDDTTNYVTTSANQIIDGLYLPKGRIEVRHPGVKIRNNVISTGWDASRLYVQNNCGIVANPNFDTRGLIIEDTTIDPVNAGANGTADDAQVSGVFGYGFTARRNAIRNVTDGLMPDVRTGFMEPSVMEGNYIQTRWLAFDKEQKDGTHNDGIQLAGGNGHIIRGNALRNPAGSATVKGQCIVFTPYHGTLDDVVVDRNWLYGSYTQISVWVAKSYGPQPQRVTITGNHHGGQCVWPLLITPEANAVKKSIAGNTASGPLVWNNGTLASGATVSPYVYSAG